MSDTSLLLSILIERQPLSADWCQALLRHLWERGLRFGPAQPVSPRWEDELGRDCTSIHDTDFATLPLAQAMERLVMEGSGALRIWDRGMQMLLSLDPDRRAVLANTQTNVGAQERTPLGQNRLGFVRLSLDGTYLDVADEPLVLPDAPPGASLLRPYQQATRAFSHWASVLCEFLRPAWAWAYDPAEEYELMKEHGERHGEIVALVERNQMPPLERWTWLTYLPAHFASAEVLGQLLARPHLRLERLSAGGVLAYMPLDDQQYESNIAYEYERLAHAAWWGTSEDFDLALRAYQRALTIFHAIGHRAGEELCRRDMSRLREVMRLRGTEAQNGRVPASQD